MNIKEQAKNFRDSNYLSDCYYLSRFKQQGIFRI